MKMLILVDMFLNRNALVADMFSESVPFPGPEGFRAVLRGSWYFITQF